MNEELSEKLDYFRATINTKNKEIVFKNGTARYMFGQQYAVFKDQKELVAKYMIFTDYLLKEIPLRKQGSHNFNTGNLLQKFEDFYTGIFGDGWQDSRDIFLNNFSKLIN